MLPLPIHLLKLMLNLLRAMNVQGKEICLGYFVTYTLSVCLCLDANEPITNTRRESGIRIQACRSRGRRLYR